MHSAFPDLATTSTWPSRSFWIESSYRDPLTRLDPEPPKTGYVDRVPSSVRRCMFDTSLQCTCLIDTEPFVVSPLVEARRPQGAATTTTFSTLGVVPGAVFLQSPEEGGIRDAESCYRFSIEVRVAKLPHPSKMTTWSLWSRTESLVDTVAIGFPRKEGVGVSE